MIKQDYNIAFHYHVPLYKNAEGKIMAPAFLGVFLDSIAQNCNKLICLLYEPLPEEISMMNYEIKSSNIEWISLGIHNSIPQRYLRLFDFLKKLKTAMKECNVLLVRTPTPMITFIHKAVAPEKLALYIVGEYSKGDLEMSFIRKQLVGLIMFFINRAIKKAAKKSLILTNSRKIYNIYEKITPDVAEIKSTTLSAKDFFVREDTYLNEEIHLTYTGRIDPVKNLPLIFEAVKKLRDEGLNIKLNMAYLLEHKTRQFFENLVELGKTLKIHDHIIYHGQKNIGEELNEVYRNSDLFIIASSTEGFPRVIWEAMANSLPVIATRVGSIPHFLTHEENAILIEPNSLNEIVSGIKRLLIDPALRKKIIKGARELVSENTLEVQGEKMVNTLMRFTDKYK